MGLTLPEYQDLSDEQRSVMNLELDRNHVVRGAPGTGKSVLALYRAQAALREDMNVMMIMFNNTLRSYTEQAAAQLSIPHTRIRTLDKWFGRFFEQRFRKAAPTLPPRRAGGYREFDWAGCFEIAAKPRDGDARDDELHIIVDEGQDFPVEAFSFLRLAAASVTVFADENQRITDRNTTVEQICRATGVDEPSELTRNYRNTRPIAEVAAHFDPSLRGGVTQVGEPPKEGGPPRLLSAQAGDAGIARIASYVRIIQRRQPAWHIGVLLPEARQQAAYYDALEEEGVAGLGMYSYDRGIMAGKAEIDFAEPGVRVLNHKSAKGLEFDLVLLPELQTMRNPDEINFARTMYVLCSRARLALILAYSGQLPTNVQDALPMELLRAQTL